MIEIRNLSRSFGYLKAVDDISFAVNTGEIVGFLGPNGAGKTTTMRMMVGYLQPGAGSIELDGESIFRDPMRTSSRIGYLAEHNPLYGDMSVGEFLEYIADLRKMPKPLFRERLAFVASKCGLQGVLRQKVQTLSKGYRQRVGLAQAILHDPDVLILDEPTSGLDPNQIIEIRELIRELGAQKTVLLSSHIMQEVQALCDRVVIINRGRIIVDDRKENLGAYMGTRQAMLVEVEAAQPDFTPWLELHPDVTLIEQSVQDAVCTLRFDIPGGEDLRRDISSFISSQGWTILGIMIEKRSLEDIFHTLTMEEELPEGSFATEENTEIPDEPQDGTISTGTDTLPPDLSRSIRSQACLDGTVSTGSDTLPPEADAPDTEDEL